MNSAEDQYRRSLALFNLASKDYNKARLDEAMYNAQPSSVQAVTDIHAQNVADMLLQKEEAKRDFDRCKLRRDELLGVETAEEEKAEEEKVEEEKVAEEEAVEIGSSSGSSSSTSSGDDSNWDDDNEEEERDWTARPANEDPLFFHRSKHLIHRCSSQATFAAIRRSISKMMPVSEQ